MASDQYIIRKATTAYIEAAMHYLRGHKGGYVGQTADEVISRYIDYDKDPKRWHDVAGATIAKGEVEVDRTRFQRFKQCHRCRTSYRKFAEETIDEFQARDLCGKCHSHDAAAAEPG